MILPSALRRALPLYSNEVILMLHATTVAFTATVPDILKVARDANSATYQSFDAFGIAALIYLVVSFALVALFRRAERHWLALPGGAHALSRHVSIARRGWLAPSRKIDPYFQRESILLHTTQTEACKLVVQDIHKRYGDNEVLKGVSLKANKPAT